MTGHYRDECANETVNSYPKTGALPVTDVDC